VVEKAKLAQIVLSGLAVSESQNEALNMAVSNRCIYGHKTVGLACAGALNSRFLVVDKAILAENTAFGVRNPCSSTNSSNRPFGIVCSSCSTHNATVFPQTPRSVRLLRLRSGSFCRIQLRSNSNGSCGPHRGPRPSAKPLVLSLRIHAVSRAADFGARAL
jgi:hypothetical protein